MWISTQKKLITPKEIKTKNGNSKFCSVKLEGLYYNSQRGDRLWPLDETSLASLKKGGKKYENLQVQGGLYTSCGTGDEYSIYGIVEHHLPGETEYFLAAGVQYDLPHNRILADSPLHCTLQLINNKTAVGYLYDYQGGVGFVGGQVPSPVQNEILSNMLNGGKCINQIFEPKTEDTLGATIGGKLREIRNENSLENLKWNLAVRGIVGLTNDIFLQSKTDIEGNFGQKSQTVRTSAVSLANAVNTARKKSEKLCRGKWNSNRGNIRCFDEGGTKELLSLEPGITYVFKNTNLELKSFMQNAINPAPVNLFIDGGLLYLPSSVHTGSLSYFSDAGYRTSKAEAVSQGNFLKGNFIINGLLAPSSEAGIENKLYVHGKLLSLNTYDTPNQERIRFIQQLLKNTFEEKRINYRELFTWSCDENVVSGIANDGTLCGKGSSEFARAPLSVIDMDFPSLLSE